MLYQITTATQKIAQLQKRIRAVQGGTGASKTISILIGLNEFAQHDTSPTLTSIVSESIPHLKKGCIRDFKSILQGHNIWYDNQWNETDKIYTYKNGSKIEFFGADQSEKLRGGRRDRLFINECNNVSFSAFEELEVRTRQFVYLDWNPVSEFWFNDELLGKRNDIDHIILNYLDNEALDEATRVSIEQRKNRPGWWKVYGLGELGEVEGRIYAGWQIIDEIPFEARLERYGVDFGYHPDPAAIAAVYYYNGGYILDEIAYRLEMANRDIADVLKNLPGKLTIADSAEPKSIAEISLYGINIIGAEKGADSKRLGIKTLQNQKISVTKRSVNLIKEYRNYFWQTDKDGRVIMGETDGADHLLDAVRYAICSLIPIITRKEMIAQMPVFPPMPRVNPL